MNNDNQVNQSDKIIMQLKRRFNLSSIEVMDEWLHGTVNVITQLIYDV